MDNISIEARRRFHAATLNSSHFLNNQDFSTNAHKTSQISVKIAKGIKDRIVANNSEQKLAKHSSRQWFENICRQFIQETLQPGLWATGLAWSRNRSLLTSFEQYAHLVALDQAAKQNPELAAVLNSDYTITPDIIISYAAEHGQQVKKQKKLMADLIASQAKVNGGNELLPFLQIGISCKWAFRSTCLQPPAEALNLIRKRKGNWPRILVITGEALPSRIASVALGTNGIDCVYHFALTELIETIEALNYQDALELLHVMIETNRIKDIAYLPFDLAACAVG